MPSIDPKDYQPKADAAPVKQADFLEAMKLLLAEIRGTENTETKARMALEAERLLLERERLSREMPENKQDPGVSVFSYPEGDLKRPKPALKCKFFWCGIDEKVEQLTPEEIELRNALAPGHYKVTKADGERIPFNVEAKYDNAGKIEQMAVSYPCRNEHRHNHLPNTSYLRQAMGAPLPSTADLTAEVARLRRDLELAKAGVAGVVSA